MTATTARAADQPIVPREGEKWVLLATILASSMAFIDSSALIVALPALIADLGLSGQEQLWVNNAYLLFLASLILVGGALGDRYGRKRVYAIGIVIFTAASILCGISTSPAFLIAARGLQGVGGALMVPGSLAIIAALITPERRGRAIGTWSTFSTLTTVLGPVLGGALAGAGLWRFVFFINVPLAVVALWALITHVPESRNPEAPPRLDFLGAALATFGLGGITYGFTEIPSAPGWVALIAGAITLVVFWIYENRIDHPMLPPEMFKSRTFTGTNLLTLFLYAALSGALFFLPLNLISIQRYPEAVAGAVNLPFGLLLAVLSRVVGGLVDRIGARLPLIIGPAIAGVGFALLAAPGLTAGESEYWTTYFPAIVVLGIGMGITVAPLTTAVMTSAPSEASGTASGINNAVARTAGVLATAIFGALALALFASTLGSRVEPLGLPGDTAAQIQAQSVNLANAMVPETLALEASQTDAATDAIRLAFVDVFRVIVLIAAALAWISAIMAAIFVEGKSPADAAHKQGEGAKPAPQT